MNFGRAVLLACAAATALAGCGSSGTGAAGTTPPVPQSSAPTSAEPSLTTTAPPIPTGTTSAATSRATSSPAASTTSTSSSTSAPTPAPTTTAIPFTTTCTALTVRVIPGGAIRGAEIAALQYVNDGRSACRISGFPTARLLRNGQQIGTPSQPNGRAAKTMTLQAGATAESLLQDFSSCEAPLSDHVRVTVPNRGSAATTTVIRPARLRACILRVAPVGPPA